MSGLREPAWVWLGQVVAVQGPCVRVRGAPMGVVGSGRSSAGALGQGWWYACVGLVASFLLQTTDAPCPHYESMLPLAKADAVFSGGILPVMQQM